MKRIWLVIIPAGIIFAVGIGFGFLLNNWLLAGDGEPSEEISAPTLDPAVIPTASVAQLSTENAVLQVQVDALSTQVASIDVSDDGTDEITMEETPDTQVVVGDPEPTEEIVPATTQDDSLGRVAFRIDAEESEVRFLIDEVLNGIPVTVVGRTNEVAGDIVIDFDNPALSQLGTVRINVRTLSTDSPRRNDAIRGRIIESAQDQYEFAEFTPTAIVGLPDNVAIGDTITFEITGDLNLHGVTNSVTFETTVTVMSADRIEGLATSIVLYADYNMRIPNVAQVSDVSDEVGLEIEFVALIVEE